MVQVDVYEMTEAEIFEFFLFVKTAVVQNKDVMISRERNLDGYISSSV